MRVLAQYEARVVREYTPWEIKRLAILPRAMMRGAGIEPSYGSRRSMPVSPTRAVHDGDFFVEESGLTLSHVHVLEAVMESAFAAAELSSGELSLRFRPGDALRAMGLKDGCRAWLRARLKELGSPFGVLPRTMGGGEFSILRTMATDTPSGKVFVNAIAGRDENGELIREAVYATIWTVRLSAGYRAWMASGASLRYSALSKLRGLKCAAAEAVARYALTGHCNKPLAALLMELGIVTDGWDANTTSARYRSARRAITGVLGLAPDLERLGVKVAWDATGAPRIVSKDRPDNCWFLPKGCVLISEAGGAKSKGSVRATAKASEVVVQESALKPSRFQELSARQRIRCDAGASHTTGSPHLDAGNSYLYTLVNVY